MWAVVLENVEKSYDGMIACSGVNLSVSKGEFFTFLGPSGCGKTTILRLVAGFIFPDKGSIYIEGKDITHTDAENRKIGMVFQNYALFPFMTVRENIEYGLKILKKPKKTIKEKRDYYLSMVGLAGYEERSISELSGGEQQRVALARSLAVEPQVLLLDEPLSNLDARLRDKMRSELKLLQRKLNITTIFVTHDQTEALTMSDRLAVFEQGRCVQVGSPEQLYSTPASSFVASFIGETNLFPCAVKQGKYVVANCLEITTRSALPGQYLSIRPQDILLSDVSIDVENTYPGEIEHKQFNGFSTDYSVRVGEIVFQVTVLNGPQANLSFEIGRQVFIGFSTDSARILEN